jgi:hypothetical protein
LGPEVRGANIAIVLFGRRNGWTVFVLMLNLQDVLGYSAIKAGLASIPLGLVLIALAGMSGPVVERLGAKRVLLSNSYLTDEQNTLLTSLPHLEPTIDSAIDGYLALARIFLPRAHRRAERTGHASSQAHEDANVAYFERSLGVHSTADTADAWR